MRELYKDKKITAIFQPHLYTRTRDFYQDFADSLSLLDEVILVDIYPAREAPIPGDTRTEIIINQFAGDARNRCFACRIDIYQNYFVEQREAVGKVLIKVACTGI